jgi:DNA-binding XRE family transcriptional regulator
MRQTLKEARAKADKTQKEIATAIGISESMYKAIEAGNREGKGYIWDKLQDLFGIDQRELRKVTETNKAAARTASTTAKAGAATPVKRI